MNVNIEMHHSAPSHNCIRCRGCAQCCISPWLPVTDAEVRAIMRTTGLPAKQIVQFAQPQDLTWPENAADWIQTTTGRRLMILRRKNGQCMFLANNRCSIYADRPFVCRIFPVDFMFTEDDEIHADMQYRLLECLAELPKRPTENLELVYYARALKNADHAFQEKIAEWNCSNRRHSQNGFLDFLFSE